MKIAFVKYHGAGNDFILTYGGKKGLGLRPQQIRNLCHRQLGIGADGFLEIMRTPQADFAVRYHNSDGNVGTLCGNGSRCAVHFARKLKLCGRKARFLAADGLHEGYLTQKRTVRISIRDVHLTPNTLPLFVDTGSPHLVFQVPDLDAVDVEQQGRLIRFSDAYRATGVNVNFMSLEDGQLRLRTYERGVEAETLSCGSGAVAAAIAAAVWRNQQGASIRVPVVSAGGTLVVTFSREKPEWFTDIWLEGPVEPVFSGTITIGKA
ncbi:MAG: diaminopimelate epimerase [Chitinophagales bacterium]|nr:diaminopimelate epimerase [Chitinophagales bacterium]MDW8393007.1 diaminopimelate epimerase [Chitinophagales bacterium]